MPISRADMGATVWPVGHVGSAAPPIATEAGSDACSPGSATGVAATMETRTSGGQLGIQPLLLAVQLVESVDIRLRRRNQDVGVRTQTVDDASFAFQPHRHLALGVGAGGDRIDGVEEH